MRNCFFIRTTYNKKKISKYISSHHIFISISSIPLIIFFNYFNYFNKILRFQNKESNTSIANTLSNHYIIKKKKEIKQKKKDER